MDNLLLGMSALCVAAAFLVQLSRIRELEFDVRALKSRLDEQKGRVDQDHWDLFRLADELGYKFVDRAPCREIVKRGP